LNHAVYCTARQATGDNMAHAHCMLEGGEGQPNTTAVVLNI